MTTILTSDQMQRFNSRRLLKMLYVREPSKRVSRGKLSVMMYCRAVKSFIYEGVRMYSVRQCNSITGDMTGPVYSVPFNLLEATDTKFKKARPPWQLQYSPPPSKRSSSAKRKSPTKP